MPKQIESNSLEKPKLRGFLHQYAFFFFFPLEIWLMTLAEGQTEVVVTLIYCLGLSSLLATSALYHRINWADKQRERMRKLDHTMIFVQIATSYTPFGVLAFSGLKNQIVLSILWISVVVGFMINMIWGAAPKWVSALLYVSVGWTVVVMFPEFYQYTGSTIFYLMLFGGISYTIGAMFYAAKRPDLKPGIFGYHELFHSFVILGAGLHYASIYMLITSV
ncbi:MAG: hemolysin III [Deltaproteobacteria bacterium]|nr:hemolysin III [Deltaproteobacteria bacterium]